MSGRACQSCALTGRDKDASYDIINTTAAPIKPRRMIAYSAQNRCLDIGPSQ